MWPCSNEPEKAILAPNKDGFWCCPLCGGSYGRKEEPPLAFMVEIEDMTTIVFATTAAKARWIAVKGYWEAFGRNGWPRPQSGRIPKYDNSPLRFKGRKCWTEDHVREMQP
jgi:hypothetical protein